MPPSRRAPTRLDQIRTSRNPWFACAAIAACYGEPAQMSENERTRLTRSISCSSSRRIRCCSTLPGRRRLFVSRICTRASAGSRRVSACASPAPRRSCPSSVGLPLADLEPLPRAEVADLGRAGGPTQRARECRSTPAIARHRAVAAPHAARTSGYAKTRRIA